MKKRLFLAIFGLVTSLHLFGQCTTDDCDPEVTGMTFSKTCIGTTETDLLTVNWIINSADGSCTSPAGSWRLQIQLPLTGEYGVLDATSVAGPEFTWTYDAGLKVLNGTTNQAMIVDVNFPFSMGFPVQASGSVAITVNGFSATNTCLSGGGPLSNTNISIIPNPIGGCQQAFANNIANDEKSTSLNVETTVPVILASFEAESTDCNEAQLSWTTVAEVNNSHFEVLRSYDGRSFETITLVEGNGTTSDVKEYTYVDREFKTQGEYVYYSLKQVDYDGSSQRFENKSIKNTCEFGELSLELFPNPTAEELNLSILDFPSNESQVTVLINGADGQLAKKETINSFGGEAQINLEELKPGIYLLKLITEFQTMEKRFIKIK